MYERLSQPPLPRSAFLKRVALHVGIVLALIMFSIVAGMAGYVLVEGMEPADAFLHSAHMLGGMGLVNTPVSAGGKLFAGLYALYAGLVFLASFSIMMAPVVHRLLHTFHWDEDARGAD